MGDHVTSISGADLAALVAATSAFLNDKSISSRYKDLRHYEIDVTYDQQRAHVHFIPIREAGEAATIGCCTRHGMEINYEVDLRSERVVDHAIAR
jgi:hypothetical protein